MEWLEQTQAWQAAMGVIERQSKPKVSEFDADWAQAFINLHSKEINKAVSHYTGLPGEAPRFMVVNDYRLYLKARLKGYSPTELNGPYSAELGRLIGNNATDIGGEYLDSSGTVALFAPKLFDKAGRSRLRQEALLFTVGAHEATHHKVRQNITWLPRYRKRLAEAVNAMDISSPAQAALDAAERTSIMSVLTVLSQFEEGYADDISWRASREAGKQNLLDPEKTNLTVDELQADTLTKVHLSHYREGLEILNRARGDVKATHWLWRDPPRARVLHDPAQWPVASMLSSRSQSPEPEVFSASLKSQVPPWFVSNAASGGRRTKLG